jgi:hypothetical protein
MLCVLVRLQVTRALARLVQYENFRLADLVIVNGLPRFLLRLARRASESILRGMYPNDGPNLKDVGERSAQQETASQMLRCRRLAL